MVPLDTENEMSGNTDILIVGWTELPPVTGSKKIRQVRLDFAGLSEADSLLPEVGTVIVMSNTDDFSRMPTEEEVRSFHSKERGYPILDMLEQCEPAKCGLRQGVQSVTQKLENLPSCKRADFIQQASDIAIELFYERTFIVVHAGVKAFLLMSKPEDPENYPPETTILPGMEPNVCVDFDETWASHVEGKYAWLLEGTRPPLRFNQVPIPNEPFQYPFLKSLPPESEGVMYAGALDRAGGCRLMYFHLGGGEVVITSDVALGNLLTRLRSEAQDDATPFPSDTDGASAVRPIESESKAKDIHPGWTRGGLVLKSLPNGRVPAVFSFSSRNYTVPSGKAWEIVQQLIADNAFDGHGVPLDRPGDYFKKQHRLFFNSLVTKNESGWYIKTK